jgi:hypothetical protein
MVNAASTVFGPLVERIGYVMIFCSHLVIGAAVLTAAGGAVYLIKRRKVERVGK